MKCKNFENLKKARLRGLLLAAIASGFAGAQAGETTFATFDADAAGWYWENWSAAGSSVTFDGALNSAAEGIPSTSGSLKLVNAFNGNPGYQQAVYSIQFPTPQDFESTGAITLDVKVEESSTPRFDGDYGWLEIILRQGNDWTWTGLPGVRLNGTGWQRVTVPVPKDVTVDSVRAFTIKLGENDFLGPVTLNVDNIAFTTTPDDVVITGADNGAVEVPPDGWSWESWSTTGIVSWDPLDVAGRSTSGSIKLDHQFIEGPGTYQQSVFTYVLPGGQINAAQEYSHLNLDVRVDPSSTPRASGDYGYFEVILRNGSGWTWLSTTPEGGTGTGLRFTDNEWHRISVKVPSTADQVHRLTFKVGENAILGPVILNIDNITWTRNTAPIPAPTVAIKPANSGLSLVATSTDQYGRHNIYTVDGGNGEFSFVNTTEPVSYSFTLDSFPAAENYSGFQAHIFLVPGFPGTETSPDWNQPTLIFMDIKAGNGGAGNATFRIKTDQPGGNSELYAAGLTTVNSASIVGTWTLTANGNVFTMTAPDGTVSDPIDIGTEAAAFFNMGDPSPLRVYFGIQPNGTANIGQGAKIGGVKITKGANVALEDNFNGTALDELKWVPNATPGGVQFISPDDAGYIVSWSIPDAGFVLKSSASLNPQNWTDVTATPIAIGQTKQVALPKSELPAGSEAYFVLEKPAP